MGYYADIYRIRRQGLPESERFFVEWAIQYAVARFVHGTEPRLQVVDCGEWGTACEPVDEDITAALLAPVCFAAVVADVCRALQVREPFDVEQALSGVDKPRPDV